MMVVRFLVNSVVLAVELGLIVAAAWLGWRYPLAFAMATAGITVVLGGVLEYQRLAHEMPFYFGTTLSGVRAVLARLFASGEALAKGLLAGVVTLLTFSGTDSGRLFWVAVLFAGCLFLGTFALLRVSLGWRARALRWGYFRLAAPLGLVFSGGLTTLVAGGVVPQPSIQAVAYDAVVNLPLRPSVAEASEFLFKLKQAVDGLMLALLRQVLPAGGWAEAVQVVISTNMLTGFVLAVLVVAIAGVVLGLEGLLYAGAQSGEQSGEQSGVRSTGRE